MNLHRLEPEPGTRNPELGADRPTRALASLKGATALDLELRIRNLGIDNCRLLPTGTRNPELGTYCPTLLRP